MDNSTYGTFSINLQFRFTTGKGKERPVLSTRDRIQTLLDRLMAFDVGHRLTPEMLSVVASAAGIEMAGESGGYFSVRTGLYPADQTPGKLHVVHNGTTQLQYELDYIKPRPNREALAIDSNDVLAQGLMNMASFYGYPNDVNVGSLYHTLKQSNPSENPVDLLLDDGVWILMAYNHVLAAYVKGIGFRTIAPTPISEFRVRLPRLVPVCSIMERALGLTVPGGKMPGWWTPKQTAQVAMALLSNGAEKADKER